MLDLWHRLPWPDRLCLRLLAHAALATAWCVSGLLVVPRFGPPPWPFGWVPFLVSWQGAAWLFLGHVALSAGAALVLLAAVSKGARDA